MTAVLPIWRSMEILVTDKDAEALQWFMGNAVRHLVAGDVPTAGLRTAVQILYGVECDRCRWVSSDGLAVTFLPEPKKALQV